MVWYQRHLMLRRNHSAEDERRDRLHDTQISLLDPVSPTNTQEWRWSTLHLAEFIPTPAWLHYCHSKRTICMRPFFVISSFKEEPAEGSPRLRLRRRPRSGPPSPAPSYQAFPRPPSAEWPGGCPTPAPSSPRSSATQETEHTQSCRDSSLSTLKIPRTPSQTDFRRQKWNQHQPCSSRVKAELGAFYTEMKPILLILLSRFYCLQAEQ